jgi:hypothetical protein
MKILAPVSASEAKIALASSEVRPEHRRPVLEELRILADGRIGLAIGAFDPERRSAGPKSRIAIRP